MTEVASYNMVTPREMTQIAKPTAVQIRYFSLIDDSILFMFFCGYYLIFIGFFCKSNGVFSNITHYCLLLHHLSTFVNY